MIRFYYLLILLTSTSVIYSQQFRTAIDKNSIVRDSTGRQYLYEEWKPLVQSNQYFLAGKDSSGHQIYVLKKRSPERTQELMKTGPKPVESSFFKTGEAFPPLKDKTIEGEKIVTRDLKGKILVVNYWFIDCMPCRMEIPEFNEIVKTYASDSSVVFISIARDAKHDLKKFLKTTPFLFKVIAEGGQKIGTFPTTVVVSKEGKVAFHTSGYSQFSPYWIKKTIEELKVVP